jgi:putative PIN family toxin of toxin-antitoxin system
VKVILDTNVFVSGVFFRGPPYEILESWRDGKIQLVVSPEILEEYQRVGEVLAKQFSNVELAPVIDLLAVEAKLVLPPRLPEQVCTDPDDDKFLACALTSKTKFVISGDKHLLGVSSYRGIRIVRPRKFVERYRTGRMGS